ncbi:MAG: choice-of-anchor J domain-containing protein [Roseibacillus sp.]|nr:choice-of-anchor J domain-containing protein [Roseibacillus sp.]
MPARHLHPVTLTTTISVISLLFVTRQEAWSSPLLDEVMALEETNSIKYDPDNSNHRSVGRIEFLGLTVAADGDYQYWYDIVSGNRAWTRDVSFWVSNADTITNMADRNYTETGAENVLEHWWGSPMAYKGLNIWGGHRDSQNSPSHNQGGTWALTPGHPDPILNEFHDPTAYNVPGFFTGQPTAFFWGPPSRTDDSLSLSDGTPVWRFEKNHYLPFVNNSNLYPFSGICGTFIIESSNPPADDAFGWSTYHNTTVNDSQSLVTSFGYLPGPGNGAPAGKIHLKVTRNNGLLDFSWNSQAGKQYDLVSSTNLTTPPATWPIYDDGTGLFQNILESGKGSTSLTGVNLVGPRRFFAIVEEELGTLLSEDFDGSAALPQGWTTTGADTTAWEIGVPTDTLFGPIAAHSPPYCAGTNIAGDYTSSQDISLITPVISVPVTGATLTYHQWRDTEGDSDGGSIRVLDADNNDALIEEFVNLIEWNDTNWNTSDPVALPASASGKNIRLEFRFVSNESAPESFAGLYLDNIVLMAD